MTQLDAGYETKLSHSDFSSGGVPLIDPVTELPIVDLEPADLGDRYVSANGVITELGELRFGSFLRVLGIVDGSYDQVPFGTFRGGQQTRRIGVLSPEPFYGGAQSDECIEENIARHELTYVSSVVREIFDGRNDLTDIDTSFLLSTESGMPQTLRSLFINRPGQGGGLSSLRHVFIGDKSGGRHVAAFEPGLAESRHDVWRPFKAVVSPDGRQRINFVTDEVTGEKKVVPHETSMFPVGMDSLSVLMSITDAWQHRLDEVDYLTDVNEAKQARVYEVPVDVGREVGELTIRLVTDLRTREDKIRTAFPLI